MFPSFEVEKFLISCGADVNALNDNRSTPLHLVVNTESYDPNVRGASSIQFYCEYKVQGKYNAQYSLNIQMVEHLLEQGAHLDQLDKSNRSPLALLLAKPYLGFSPLSHLSLKCMTARVIGQHRIPYTSSDLPRELVKFVDLHRPQLPDGDVEGYYWGLNIRSGAKPLRLLNED